MGLVEHAEKELRLAGYNIDKYSEYTYNGVLNVLKKTEDAVKTTSFSSSKEKQEKETDKMLSNYSDLCASAALDLVKVFAKQNHSGMSAQFTFQLFKALVNWEALTELTDNKEDWEDISKSCGEPMWQSKRDCSCFSPDLKYYYDIDDPDNNIYEKDENGKLTGYAQLKQRKDRKMVELKHHEGKAGKETTQTV